MDLAQPFCLNDWLIDPTLDEISRDGVVIRIEPRQMKLLVLLARHAGEIVSVASIEEAVWDEEIVSPNSLHRAISQLRLALGDDAKVQRYVETVPRRGYRLIASVEICVPTAKSCEAAAPIVASAIEACATPSLGESSDPVPMMVGEPRRSTVPRKAVVLLGVAALILIVAGIVWERIEARRAAAARDRADQLAHFMVNVFARDGFVAREPTAAELTERAVQRMSPDMPQQPDVRAKMYDAIATSYLNSGFTDRAAAPFQQALEIRRRSGQHADVGEMLRRLGEVHLRLGRFDESESAYREALAVFRVAKGEYSSEYAGALWELGRLESNRDRPETALRLLDESLRRMRAAVGPRHSNVADILTSISATRLYMGDLTRAEHAALEAIQIYTHALPDADPRRAWAEAYLGDALFFQGRLDEAAKVLERVRDTAVRVHGARSLTFARTLEKLGDVYFSQGRVTDGENAMAAAIAILEGLGERERGYEVLASTKQSLALRVLELGQASRAEQLLREAIDLHARATNPPMPNAAAEHFLAEALLAQGRLEQAEPFANSAVDLYSKSGYVPWFVERSKSTLGEILYRQGRKDEGKRLILESYQRLSSDESARPAAKDKARQRARLISARQ